MAPQAKHTTRSSHDIGHLQRALPHLTLWICRNQFLGYCNIDFSDRLIYFLVASTTNGKLLSDERSLTCVKKRIHDTCLTELIEADCKGCILCSTWHFHLNIYISMFLFCSVFYINLFVWVSPRLHDLTLKLSFYSILFYSILFYSILFYHISYHIISYQSIA